MIPREGQEKINKPIKTLSFRLMDLRNVTKLKLIRRKIPEKPLPHEHPPLIQTVQDGLLDQVDPDAPRTIAEAFLLGPYHAPQPRYPAAIGAITFPIATESEDAQRWFNQGLALLHTLSYQDAQRAFRSAKGSVLHS